MGPIFFSGSPNGHPNHLSRPGRSAPEVRLAAPWRAYSTERCISCISTPSNVALVGNLEGNMRDGTPPNLKSLSSRSARRIFSGSTDIIFDLLSLGQSSSEESEYGQFGVELRISRDGTCHRWGASMPAMIPRAMCGTLGHSGLTRAHGTCDPKYTVEGRLTSSRTHLVTNKYDRRENAGM